MRLNPHYSMLFLGSLNLVFLGLFPFLSLLYFSYYIKKSLNQRLVFMDSRPHNESLQRRNLMNNKVIKWKAPDHEGIRNERYCNTNKATKTFFVMVFTFIILHSLRFVTSLGEFIVILGKNKISNDNLKYDGGPEWLNVLVMIGSICMVINASINFLRQMRHPFFMVRYTFIIHGVRRARAATWRCGCRWQCANRQVQRC